MSQLRRPSSRYVCETIGRRPWLTRSTQPPPPPAEAQGCDKYYFYGWPVTAATLERLLTKYEPPPGSTHYLQTVIMLSRGLQAASTFRPIYCTFIQPHEEDGPLPTLRRPLPGLSFFMISASEDAGGQPFSSRRATREQMDKLVEIIGSEPCWRQDAWPKSKFCYY